MKTEIEKRASKFINETDTMQFSIMELIVMFAEKELEAINFTDSSLQLFGKSTVDVDGATKGKKYKIIFENKETYIFINDYDDADEMYKKYFEIMEAK